MAIEKDFLIIGSGIEGLTFALKASQFGSVAIVTKDELDETVDSGGIDSEVLSEWEKRLEGLT